MIGRNKAMGLRRLANEMNAVQRDFVHLVFRRLRLNHKATPAEIESAMRQLDAGVLDEVIEQIAPPIGPVASERYVDIQPFNHEAWKARHGEKD